MDPGRTIRVANVNVERLSKSPHLLRIFFEPVGEITGVYLEAIAEGWVLVEFAEEVFVEKALCYDETDFLQKKVSIDHFSEAGAFIGAALPAKPGAGLSPKWAGASSAKPGIAQSIITSNGYTEKADPVHEQAPGLHFDEVVMSALSGRVDEGRRGPEVGHGVTSTNSSGHFALALTSNSGQAEVLNVVLGIDGVHVNMQAEIDDSKLATEESSPIGLTVGRSGFGASPAPRPTPLDIASPASLATPTQSKQQPRDVAYEAGIDRVMTPCTGESYRRLKDAESSTDSTESRLASTKTESTDVPMTREEGVHVPKILTQTRVRHQLVEEILDVHVPAAHAGIVRAPASPSSDHAVRLASLEVLTSSQQRSIDSIEARLVACEAAIMAAPNRFIAACEETHKTVTTTEFKRALDDAIVCGREHEKLHRRFQESVHEAEKAVNEGERRAASLQENVAKINEGLVPISVELEEQERRAASMVETVQAMAGEPIWQSLRELQDAVALGSEQLHRKCVESVQEAEQAAKESESLFASLQENACKMRKDLLPMSVELDDQERRVASMIETIRATAADPIWQALRELQEVVAHGSNHEQLQNRYRDSIHEAEQAAKEGECRIASLREGVRKIREDLVPISLELEGHERRVASMVETIQATAGEPIWQSLRELQEVVADGSEHEQLRNKCRESIHEAEQAAKEGECRMASLQEDARKIREDLVPISLELEGQERRVASMVETIQATAGEAIWQSLRELQDVVADGSEHEQLRNKCRESIHEAEQAAKEGERCLAPLVETASKMRENLEHLGSALEGQERRVASMVETVRATADEPIWQALRELQEVVACKVKQETVDRNNACVADGGHSERQPGVVRCYSAPVRTLASPTSQPSAVIRTSATMPANFIPELERRVLGHTDASIIEDCRPVQQTGVVRCYSAPQVHTDASPTLQPAALPSAVIRTSTTLPASGIRDSEHRVLGHIDASVTEDGYPVRQAGVVRFYSAPPVHTTGVPPMAQSVGLPTNVVHTTGTRQANGIVEHVIPGSRMATPSPHVVRGGSVHSTRTTKVQNAERCVCGSVFTVDSFFCRKCGARRKEMEPTTLSQPAASFTSPLRPASLVGSATQSPISGTRSPASELRQTQSPSAATRSPSFEPRQPRLRKLSQAEVSRASLSPTATTRSVMVAD